MTDVAYNFLSKRKRKVPFLTVWEEVTKVLKLEGSAKERKIAEFYTEMMLDKRFVSLEDNCWDLRSRHAFSIIQVDPLDLDDDEEEFDEDEENLEEEED